MTTQQEKYIRLALYGCDEPYIALLSKKDTPEKQRAKRGLIYAAQRITRINQLNPTLLAIPYKFTSYRTLLKKYSVFDFVRMFAKLNLILPHEHEIPSLSELQGEVKVPARGPGGKFLPKARLLEVGTDGADTQENSTAGVETVEGA